MNKKFLDFLLAVIMLTALLLGGCGKKEPPESALDSPDALTQALAESYKLELGISDEDALALAREAINELEAESTDTSQQTSVGNSVTEYEHFDKSPEWSEYSTYSDVIQVDDTIYSIGMSFDEFLKIVDSSKVEYTCDSTPDKLITKSDTVTFMEKKTKIITTLIIVIGCILLIISSFMPVAHIDEGFQEWDYDTNYNGWFILFGCIIIIIFRLLKKYVPVHIFAFISLFFSVWISCSIPILKYFGGISDINITFKAGYFFLLLGSILLLMGTIMSMIEKHRIKVGEQKTTRQKNDTPTYYERKNNQ